MPTTRRRSPPRSTLWDDLLFYPPTLSSLVNHSSPSTDPRALPPSIRFRDQAPPPFGTNSRVRYQTLQQEIDALEHEEEDHDIRNSEIKEFGYSWLVPLGRQTTHEEEDDEGSQFSTSPTTGQPHRALDLLPPPPEIDDPAAMNAGLAGRRRVYDEPRGGGGEGARAEEPVVDLDADIEDADREDSDSEEDGDGEEENSVRGSVDESGSETGQTRGAPVALGERQERSIDSDSV